MYISDSSVKIGEDAFYGCGALKKVRVPESVEDISADAFRECGAVTLYSAEGSPVQAYCEAASIGFSKELGDVNGDGKININDVTLIQLYRAKYIDFTDEELAAADANYDSTVDIYDVSFVQMYIAKLI